MRCVYPTWVRGVLTMDRHPAIVSFYRSKRWQKCREAYAASVGHLCERCEASGLIRPGEIVHHIIHVTPDNVGDPSVTLNFDNLQLLCRLCHAAVHEEIYGKNERRYFLQNGKVVPKD